MTCNKKILFNIKRNHPLNIRYFSSLINELKKISGYEIVSHDLMNEKELEIISKEYKFDFIFLVNQYPSKNFKRSNNLRFIIWIQDIYPDTEKNINNSILDDTDIIYFLGDEEVMGYQNYRFEKRYLFYGVDDIFFKNFKFKKKEDYENDFLFIGDLLIPRFFFKLKPKIYSTINNNDFTINLNKTLKENFHISLKERIYYIMKKINPLIFTIIEEIKKIKKKQFFKKRNYKTIFNLRIKLIIEKIGAIIEKIGGKIKFFYKLTKKKEFKDSFLYLIWYKKALSNFFINYDYLSGALNIKKFQEQKKTINFKNSIVRQLVIDFVRTIDRVLLLSLALNISKKIKIITHQKNLDKAWSGYKFSKNVFYIKDQSNKKIIGFFQNSKINLVTNSQNYFTLSRSLESMACGGLVMTHQSKSNPSFDHRIGGVLKHFEENTHFAFFDKNNFGESVKEFLENDNLRKKIITNAHHIVKNEHHISLRAKQIYKDMIF